METKKETLTQLVRSHLESGHSITSLEAIRLFGATRLSAIIYTLRHAYGLPIAGERIVVPTRRGVNANVMRYKLSNLTNQTNLSNQTNQTNRR